jgi:hypothetical protein
MQPLRNDNPQWSECDLIRRLCHALDIAERAIVHLAQSGYTDPKRPEASIRPEKVIAETALLLYGAALAQRHSEVSARIGRVARQLAPHARSPQIRLGLALNPALAFDYSLGHILLDRLGFPDSGFDRLLNECRAAQASGGRERLPYRALEQEWIDSLREGGAPKNVRRLVRATRLTILTRPIDLFSATDEDLYAFTHAVMYATGLELTPAALPRTRAVTLAEAEAALARCLDAQDYDLAGEILLAWPLTGKSWSAAAAFAFHVLAGVEDKAGFLPTPATRVSELQVRDGADRSRYLLATAYHTAYVMGLLCAAALQPGCAPPARVTLPMRTQTPGCARRILPLLDDGSAAPHWREPFARLTGDEADALAGFLFNVALQRKAAARDFKSLAQVLRLGYDLGLATTPAASQAAELLGRVAFCAECAAAPSSEGAVSTHEAPSATKGASTLERTLPFGFAVVANPSGAAVFAS